MAEFKFKSGLPFTRKVRFVDGKNIWPTLDSFEIRSQYRTEKQTSSRLLVDLAQFMTTSYGVDEQANDIIITWSMTGAETRALDSSFGFFEIIISDPGVVDSRGIVLLEDTLEFVTTATNTGALT